MFGGEELHDELERLHPASVCVCVCVFEMWLPCDEVATRSERDSFNR